MSKFIKQLRKKFIVKCKKNSLMNIKEVYISRLRIENQFKAIGELQKHNDALADKVSMLETQISMFEQKI